MAVGDVISIIGPSGATMTYQPAAGTESMISQIDLNGANRYQKFDGVSSQMVLRYQGHLSPTSLARYKKLDPALQVLLLQQFPLLWKHQIQSQLLLAMQSVFLVSTISSQVLI